MRRLHIAAVAGAYVALALMHGGYSARLLGALTALIWWAVIVGLWSGAWPRVAAPPAAIAAAGALIALSAFTALSMGWAGDGGAAFVTVVRIAGYAGLLTLVVVASARGDARVWLGGLAIGIAIVAALALGSRIQPGLPGGDAEIAKFLPSASGRLSYPIAYWNGLAASLAAGVVLFTWFAGEARSRAARILSCAAIPIAALALYYTSSRGGVVAAAIGVAVLLALVPSRSRAVAGLAVAGAGSAILIVLAARRGALLDGLGQPGAGAEGDQMLLATLLVVAAVALARLALDRRLQRVAVPTVAGRIAAGLVALAALVALVASHPAQRFDEFKAPPSAAAPGTGFVASHLASGNGSGRWQYWSAARSAFRSEPVRGIGAGGYEPWWNQHGSLSTPTKNAHSLFLETLAELGLVGLALVLVFLGSGVIAGIGRLRSHHRTEAAVALGVVAAGIASAAVDWTFQLPAAFGPVVVALGVLVGPATLAERNDDAGLRGPIGVRLAGVVFGFAAIWAGAVLFATEQRLADSQTAARAGDFVAAAKAAGDAGALEPWAAAPKLQLALVQELGGDIPDARHSIHDAIESAPEDWRLWLVSARLDVIAGDVPAGRRALARARRLNPRAPIFATPAAAPPR
jgi:hypothetical protein